ncbi:MAG TPA: PDZ domain-containing protein [Gemmatimonadaceae bacterium]|nr:PDZ domain-containing protein [Gemmatimonadaceae bacterium]
MMPRVRVSSWVPLVGLVISAPCVMAQTPMAQRDSDRVYRLQLRRSADTAYLRSLRSLLQDRLDSLQHEVEGLGLDAPDRVDLVRELRSIITSLADISEQEQGNRVRVLDPSGSMSSPNARALAQQAREFARSLPRGAVRSLQPGWIGINAQGTQQRIVRKDSVYIRYFNYPQVISVEPSSPAERAGILRGDALLAYNGADLRDHEINLTKLLQPSRRITVTVRRDGEDREYDVTVTKAPPQIEALRGFSPPDFAGDSMPLAIMRMPRNGLLTRPTPQIRIFEGRDAGVVPVMGATLVSINDESLGQIFGVSSGVLVTRVFYDPARSSGLRGGDVIRRADGRDITEVAQLRRIVAAHGGDRNVELEIVRKNRTRTLTLRW